MPKLRLEILCPKLYHSLTKIQLRLDFDTFVITGPSTLSTSVGKVNPNSALDVTTASQCLTDVFSVTNPNGQTPPQICGTNSGEHSKFILMIASSKGFFNSFSISQFKILSKVESHFRLAPTNSQIQAFMSLIKGPNNF